MHPSQSPPFLEALKKKIAAALVIKTPKKQPKGRKGRKGNKNENS